MKILLHICCANCALYPLQDLQKQGHEIFGFFYNPNIHPYQEYQKRLSALQEIEDQLKIRVIYQNHYDLEGFLRKVVFREQERCRFCYHTRLEATARVAKKGKFDAFTSTLLGSKHQQHDLIKKIGIAAGEENGVDFFYADFRSGWQAGMEMSKKLNIYRQQYCGCIYSEKERFLKKPRHD